MTTTYPWQRRILDNVLGFWDGLFLICEPGPRHRIRRRPQSLLPSVEPLEDRCLMANGITYFTVPTSGSQPQGCLPSRNPCHFSGLNV
jgi:hypothetical protein